MIQSGHLPVFRGDAIVFTLANYPHVQRHMQRSPLFLVYKKGINPTDFLRNYLCPHYDQCLGEAASLNLYLDCRGCDYKGARVDHLMMDFD